MQIYCDTCVYIDLFENRGNKWINFADFAINVFKKVRDKQYKLVVSDWVIEEFKRSYDEKTLNEFLDTFEKDSIIRIERTKEDIKKARELSKDNFPDALHVVLAKKADCVYLVTRNIQHFAEFRELIEITIPELF